MLSEMNNRAMKQDTDSYDKSPQMSDEEYLRWRNLIQERMGLCIRETRMDFLKRRLWERMRYLTIPNYRDYYEFILRKDQNRTEWQHLLELLVNCQSAFFRHLPSYDALMNTVLPEIAKKYFPQKQTLFFWSVGCSRGQETYSLSMAFHHALGQHSNLDASVIGTDISFRALERARKAEYSFLEVRDMPDIFREKYMTELGKSDAREGKSILLNKHLVKYRVNDHLRKPVTFRFFNLNLPNNQDIPIQDIIFCQNVFIYFGIEDRAKSILLLLKHLKPGGYLFLGPGEAVGIRVSGATLTHFKDTLCYKRTREEVHVQITQR